jgi:hypothetical protein
MTRWVHKTGTQDLKLSAEWARKNLSHILAA